MEGLIGFGVFIVALLVFLATGTPVAVATGLLGILGVYLFLPPALRPFSRRSAHLPT